ncbi:polysaccharide biosynthesis C-terminal domain-containing protein [Prochlorococcus marinus]|uniref:polysaccharide biosynthesis C-terminal domain-containing protein n=1 Tax=Prochlorococcus marinus TaxID=1219 RepID=UPI001ADD387F|nr:hypothetical protein [Prochlorococcus marinus CUG1416]MBW3051944.1 hypothetical protein [Prochlorococcus marinus str. MU1416]
MPPLRPPLRPVSLANSYEKVIFYYSGLSLIIGIILNFLLIPKIGINGAAIFSLIATFIRVFAFWNKSFKLLKVNTSFFFSGIFKLYNQ